MILHCSIFTIYQLLQWKMMSFLFKYSLLVDKPIIPELNSHARFFLQNKN